MSGAALSIVFREGIKASDLIRGPDRRGNMGRRDIKLTYQPLAQTPTREGRSSVGVLISIRAARALGCKFHLSCQPCELLEILTTGRNGQGHIPRRQSALPGTRWVTKSFTTHRVSCQLELGMGNNTRNTQREPIPSERGS